MYSNWQAAAQTAIGEVHAKLPPEATIAERRKALRAAAYWFHGNTSHGKKTWAKHCKIYLIRHGYVPPQKKAEDSPLFNQSDHYFPYRSEGQ